jgi:hypothetical protein
MPGHSPADLQDPSWMLDWLRQVDPDTGRMPLWVPGATAPEPTPAAPTS